MKKLIALAVLTALTVVACGGSGTTAITINGEGTTVADIESMFVRDEPFTKPQFASQLNFYAHYVVLADVVKEEFGVEFSPEDIDVEAQAVVDENATEGQTREEFLAERGVTELYLTRYAHLQLLDGIIAENLRADIEAEIERVPPDEMDEEEWAEARDTFTEVCASHILPRNLAGLSDEERDEVEDEARAETQDLIDQIIGGASFEDLAAEHGSDGTALTGGDLGCTSPAGWVPGFREAAIEAPIGSVVEEPVESEFGFHVLLVRERTIPTDEEVIEELTELEFNIAVDTELRTRFQEWVFAAMRGAEISVHRRFGTWETEPQPMVVAPPA